MGAAESMPADDAAGFEVVNRAFGAVFRPERLSLGLVVPIEAYPDRAVPRLERHLERVRLAEDLGLSSVWLRDVPFDVPSFGDAGQVFDPSSTSARSPRAHAP